MAWLLAQGEDIAPIPGIKRVARVEENTAVDRTELSTERVERLNNLTPAAGPTPSGFSRGAVVLFGQLSSSPGSL